MTGPEEARVVLVTGPDAPTLERLGRTVVEEGLAACVNVLPGVRSVFRWQDRLEEADEALAILKSTASRLGALETRLRELHPYEEPEFLALAVASGAAGYLAWLSAAVGEGRPDG